MRPDRFTVKTQEALVAAQRLATTRGNPQVTAHHVLAALLEQEDGIVAPVLRRANADPEGVRRRANAILDGLPTVSGDVNQEPGFAIDATEMISRAEEEARKMGDESVSTEQLPLAPAEDPKVDTGATPEQLLDAANAVRAPHRVTAQNPEDKYQA